MKNLRVNGIILLIFMFKSWSIFAQIEVHNNGLVSIGGNPSGRPGCEAFINGSANGYSLFVQHNNFSPYSCGINTNVLAPNCCSYGLDMAGSNVFYVNASGFLFCAGTFISSDSSLKTDIVKFSNTLDKLNKVNAYNYHYRQDVTLDKGVDKGKRFYADTTLRAGIMANEIQQIAPYAVKEMKNGKLAVDYIQLIPFLLQGIKELDTKTKQQEAQLSLLQSRFNNLASSIDSNGGNYKLTSSSSKTTSDFILYQNTPNPFNEQTSISYNLKGNYSKAYIYVFDLQGTLKKTYPLDNAGKITVKSNELSAGMYLYSLVVDGNQIDIKRMLLTN